MVGLPILEPRGGRKVLEVGTPRGDAGGPVGARGGPGDRGSTPETRMGS